MKLVQAYWKKKKIIVRVEPNRIGLEFMLLEDYEAEVEAEKAKEEKPKEEKPKEEKPKEEKPKEDPEEDKPKKTFKRSSGK